MLGTTAGRVFWMFRNLERSENTARLIEAGLHIALARSTAASNEWASVVATTGSTTAYNQRHDTVTPETVVDFLLRDEANPTSVHSLFDMARKNARSTRTALTREVCEAMNESWMTIDDLLCRPISTADLPAALRVIKRESTYVHGAMHGTMTRNEVHDFARLGTFVERADNTARILDVKYYLLLPSLAHVGSRLDTVQWDTILRAVSAQRAYRSSSGGEINPTDIASFLIFDSQMPRSLLFCFRKISERLSFLTDETDASSLQSKEMADRLTAQLSETSIDAILETGLHEFLTQCISKNAEVSSQIEHDFRFHA